MPTPHPSTAAWNSLIASKSGDSPLGIVQTQQNTNPPAYGTGEVFPVYYATDNDPLYTVTCDYFTVSNGSSCGSNQVHIPDGAHADNGSTDYHMTVINLQHGVEYDFWMFNDHGCGQQGYPACPGDPTPLKGGGSVSTGYLGIFGTNTFTNAANNGAMTGAGAIASNVPVQPTLIDPREWLAGAQAGGTQSINHMLAITTNCTASSHVYPAGGSDGSTSGCIPEGMVMWVNLTDAQINALNARPWVKTLLHALHHYGAFASDTGPNIGYNEVDDASFYQVGMPSQWNLFYNEVIAEGDNPDFGNGSSQLVIPLPSGMTTANIEWFPLPTPLP